MSPLLSAVRRTVLLCLPFVAVFAAGVAFSPKVSAQYPGSVGWSVLLPPNLTKGGPSLATPDSFYNADWTKPIVHFTGTHGPPIYNLFDITDPCTPGSDYGIETLDYDGSAAPKPRALHLTIQGTSSTHRESRQGTGPFRGLGNQRFSMPSCLPKAYHHPAISFLFLE